MQSVNLKKKVNDVKPKPFLRWAGGKGWLKGQIKDFLPQKGYENYHEVFLGGGAMFFHLNPKEKSFLSDLNPHLIETYQCVKNDLEVVLSFLMQMKNTKEDYYRIRAANFSNPFKRAARFIYLNQTSFNGIYRVNQKGLYNVPYGYRKKDSFDIENLRNAQKVLTNVNLSSNDFTKSLDYIKKNDLVFIDPPYTVAHNNNGFVRYNRKMFCMDEQFRLASFIEKLKEIGAYYILTNAAHEKVIEIFQNGDKHFFLTRQSLIGGKYAKRGKYKELLVTNTID